MTTEPDPFEILRRGNPVPRPSRSGHTQGEDRLLSGILALPRRSAPARVVAGVSTVCLALLVAAAFLGSRAPSETTGVACYEEADLAADTVLVANDGDPLSACAAAWAHNGSNLGPGAACVLPSGAVGVFPGSPRTCEALDLAVAKPADGGDGDRAVTVLRQLLDERLDSSTCVDLAMARSVSEDALREAGLTGWRVDDAFALAAAKGSSAGNPPCTVYSIEELTRSVRLSSLAGDVMRR